MRNISYCREKNIQNRPWADDMPTRLSQYIIESEYKHAHTPDERH